MLKDGIAPKSFFDDASHDGTLAKPLVIEKKAVTTANAPVAAAASGGKPPKGLSLMEEMKWRQTQRTGKTESTGFQLPERRKSTMGDFKSKPLNVALKPAMSNTAATSSVPPITSKAPTWAAALKPVSPSTALTGPSTAMYKLNSTPKPPVPAPSPFKVDFTKATLKPAGMKPPAPVAVADAAFIVVETVMMPPPPPVVTTAPGEKQMETIKLEDGTEINKLADGTIQQTNPNGVSIVQYPDGRSKQINADGTIIESSADGLTIVQINPDSSRIEIFPNGDERTVLPGGVIIEILKSGEKRQINSDGTEIVTYADGKRVQTDRTKTYVITTNPDGTTLQLDNTTGVTLLIKQNGEMSEVVV